MNRAVFLEPQRTLIGDDDSADPGAVRLIRGASSALASLRGLGYRIVLVANELRVADGRISEEQVDALNAQVAQLVKEQAGAVIDRFYYCPYDPQARLKKYRRDHPWRKPSPGMLRQAADDLNLDLEASWLVGISPESIAAGRSAGVRTILLRQDFQSDSSETSPDFAAHSLVEAVRIIAQKLRPQAEAADIPWPVRPRPAGVTPPAPTPTKAPSPAPAAAQPTPSPAQVSMAPAQPAAPLQPSADSPPPEAASVSSSPEAQALQAPAVSAEPEPPTIWAAPTPQKPSPAEPASPPVQQPPVIQSSPAVTETLREILGLLKRQRAERGDFAMAKMVAILVQMGAIGCALGGLYYFQQPLVFAQFFAGAALAQLAVIALLLHHGQR